MTEALRDDLVKVVGGLLLAGVGWLFRSVKRLYHEHAEMHEEYARMRKAVLILLDERRYVLWKSTRDKVVASTPQEKNALLDIAARKLRIDHSRDAVWKDAGCPKQPLRAPEGAR